MIRLALGGGAVLLDAEGMEADRDGNIADTRAVLDLTEEIERSMDDFTEAQARCSVCSPGAA